MRWIAKAAIASITLSLPLTLLGGPVAVSFRTAQPITKSACELSALRYNMIDGSEREDRFDPPIVITSTPVVREVDIPSSTKTIASVAHGCWIETVQSRGGSAPAIQAWPQATLVARFEGTKSEPKRVHAAFVDVDAEENSDVQEFACSHQGSVVRCILPALRSIHLRVERDAFAPAFFKNIRAREAETVDVGSVPLAPGYRVEGRVTSRDGGAIHNAAVQLTPVTAGEWTRSERLLQARVSSSDAKGYYGIQGVAAGTYRLASQAEGLADAVIDSLQIADRDVRVPALVHSSFARLEVLVSPSVAPDQTPWRLELRSRGTRQHESVVIAEANMSPAGTWISAPLQDGEYTIRILDAMRSQLARQDVVLEGRDERAVVTISGIAVRGRLLSGEDGVAGLLTFTTPAGLRVRAEVAADGAFAGLFPAVGSWTVSVTTPPESSTTLRLEDVEIRTQMTDELLLRLPAGQIQGLVLSQRGRPVEAVVTARRKGRIVAQSRTGVDGKFAIEHLAEVSHTVEAEGESGFAPPMDADLSETNPIAVKLSLQSLEVKGVVIGPSGRPHSGALVRLFDPATGAFEDTIADAEGRFASSARTAGALDLIVLAPPMPMIARRLSPAQWQDQHLTIAVPAQNGVLRVVTLRVPPWPVLRSADGAARSLRLFVMPRFGSSTMREFVNGAFQFVLEPGPYDLCNADDCQSVVLQPGAEVTVSFFPARERP